MSFRRVTGLAPYPSRRRCLQILLILTALVFCFHILSVHNAGNRPTVILRHLDKLHRLTGSSQNNNETITIKVDRSDTNSEAVIVETFSHNRPRWSDEHGDEKEEEEDLFKNVKLDQNIRIDDNTEDNAELMHVSRDTMSVIDVSDTSNEDPEDLEEESSEVLPSNEEETAFNPRQKGLHWTIREAGFYDKDLFSPPPNEVPKQRFPTAVIIGAGKCGTRALLEFLRMHPYITAAKDEIHFFDLDSNFRKGYEWYRSQMPFSYSNQVTIEKTPSYIWTDRAPEELYKLNKNMKLIVILRDPVARVESQVIRITSKVTSLRSLLIERNGQLKVNDECRTVMWGHYVYYLKRWMRTFPEKQIHVVEASDFTKNPAKEIQKIEDFLEIPHRITQQNFHFNATKGFYCMKPFHLKEIVCLGAEKGKYHPPQDPMAKRLFYDHYRRYNEELFKLLGRRFQWEPKE